MIYSSLNLLSFRGYSPLALYYHSVMQSAQSQAYPIIFRSFLKFRSHRYLLLAGTATQCLAPRRHHKKGGSEVGKN